MMPSPAPTAPPPRAKLMVGGLFRDRETWEAAEAALAAEFGPFANECLSFPFDHSGYYRAEMGDDLVRIFRVFRATVPQEDLAEIKHRTASLERRFADTSSGAARRRVNLDPGLLSLYNLVLASTKGYAHRVYLGRGIHAEVTLVFRGSGFKPVAWTYPDYRRPEAIAYFTAARAAWRLELRRTSATPAVAGA